MATMRQGTYGIYYGSVKNESSPLSESEMTTNAVYIYTNLINSGWTIQAIAAMLGNMQAESTMNPGRWQSEDVNNMSMGYGLVQWTPATKYIDWCTENGFSDYSEMDNNLLRIHYEVENGLQWIATDSYDMTFKEFSKSTSSVATLAKAFLLCYERPADQSESVQSYRASLAEKWYEVISGGDVPDPEPITPNYTTKKKHFNFILFNARRRRAQWTR